ncbi:MogA/MoaB family molybdenum cofactor biosynthesis protein [Marinisporobacter balticus]|uniref:Molybdenum cofactor synthesis domain-containing protein n=1 Tax=Marinisporobacter balticus TaxID=2018667 RepID=A0A4R2KUC2_9FIRM|nr:MogA/MoaB family molybdenum cofactor biosynthesis protein [Marinisporobacter balticus]TCO77403.1 molybdenum cofactor synthesis domain-containing protein [Marinisporobacter balticus]
MYKMGIITVSDKGAAGEREDISGKQIQTIMMEYEYMICGYTIVPDDKDVIKKELIHMADNLNVQLILTTGGTGFSQRDVTPEATLEVVDRIAPGIVEAIRGNSMTITKRAMLSRAVSGIRNKTLIVNLPGSPKAVKESLLFIIDELEHGIDILTGQSAECARR